MSDVSNCIVCGCPLSGKQRSFCCTKCKNEHFLSYRAQKIRADRRKAELIANRGGKCGRCGYGFSIDALSFYDQAGKSLHIDASVLANSSTANLHNKLKRAQVLCRNCYEELQSPMGQALKQPARAEHHSGGVQNDIDLTEITKKFAENLAKSGVKSGQTIVLGVSGGVDSIVMLDLSAKAGLELKIIVAHMNHGVRKEALLDERLVASLARKHGLKYISKTIVPPKAGNLEEGLRDARREFLLAAANNNNAAFVALAHNANDQAETLILNLVRGSGPAGLGAMNMNEGNIVRPLLSVSRDEIENYAVANGLDWHEDATNLDTSYDRNYIRHRLLPMLERLNPEYLGSIYRTTYLQREIDAHFKQEAYRVIQNTVVIPAKAGIQKKEELGSWLATRNDRGAKIPTTALHHLDKPLLYETLGLLYEEVRGNRKDLTLKHLFSIEQMIANAKGSKTLDLPHGIAARRRYDSLDFYLKKEHNIPSAPSTKKLRLGTQKFGQWNITVTPLGVIPAKAGIQKVGAVRLDSSLRWNDGEMGRNNTLEIDAETLETLVVRTRKPGDTIAKKGLKGKKKLQDLFVDAKIDRVKRGNYPIIADSESDTILWVPGLAKSEYKPKSKIDLYQITIEEAEHETKKI